MKHNNPFESPSVGEWQYKPANDSGLTPKGVPIQALRILQGLEAPSASYSTTKQLNEVMSGCFTLGELLDRSTEEVPQLLTPLLPRQGVAMLAGSSDTGKSSFLRQLALAIVMKEPTFLGFPILAKHHSAICISTEDGDEAIGPLIKKQLHGQTVPDDARKRLHFVFDTERLIAKLDFMLAQNPADLVVVDALADLFEGSLNQSNEVRRFIKHYHDLAVKHGCLILFMHHTGKRSEEREPSKNNLLGSQGLEAKMRVVFELRADPYNLGLRHLCVLKGNYLSSEIKSKSFVLRFDENMRFYQTGEHVNFGELVKAPQESAAERELVAIAKDFLNAGNSYGKTAALLEPIAKSLGVPTIPRTSLNRRFPKSVLKKPIPPSQNIMNGTTGCAKQQLDEFVDHPNSSFTSDQVSCLFLSGNTLSEAQILVELEMHHKGNAADLFKRLQLEGQIEPAPSNKDYWRITPRES
jgi:hypothetical protein